MRRIKDLDPRSAARAELSAQMLEKCHSAGLVPTKWNLEACDAVSASAFCRRRLPVLMVRAKMSESVRTATQLVEQGHVRVGPDVVKDPAFLVPRAMEDFVTWVDGSAVRKKVLEYGDMRDDYDINC